MASDALLVSAFSLGAVSRFYILSSILRVASAFAYATLTRSRGGPDADRAVLLAATATMAASSLAAESGSEAAIYAACAAAQIVPPLLPLVAFNAAMACFHARQAKRLLPLVAAAATA